MVDERSIVLLFLYAKNEKADLAPREISLLVRIRNEAIAQVKELRREKLR
jgi:hypothetical protein